MERPLPVLAFTLQHRLGVGYELHRSNWGGTASVFSHDINEQLGEDGYALRLYYNPSKSLRRVAHLGVSGVSFKTDEDARLRARPESHRTDTRLVDTREQDDVDVSSAFGLEFAGLVGPVTVRSEFYRMGWERKERRDLAFSGSYVEGSWFLTGETRRESPLPRRRAGPSRFRRWSLRHGRSRPPGPRPRLPRGPRRGGRRSRRPRRR